MRGGYVKCFAGSRDGCAADGHAHQAALRVGGSNGTIERQRRARPTMAGAVSCCGRGRVGGRRTPDLGLLLVTLNAGCYPRSNSTRARLRELDAEAAELDENGRRALISCCG
jgi:hypothetical protein